MGKLRIVKQYGVYRVEEECSRTGQYNESYKYWSTIGNKNFENQEDAEKYADEYLKKLEDQKEVVIKEYKF